MAKSVENGESKPMGMKSSGVPGTPNTQFGAVKCSFVTVVIFKSDALYLLSLNKSNVVCIRFKDSGGTDSPTS